MSARTDLCGGAISDDRPYRDLSECIARSRQLTFRVRVALNREESRLEGIFVGGRPARLGLTSLAI